MIPTQNCGMPRPTSGTARTTWSRSPFFLVAASVARGTAMRIERIVPYASSHSVTGSRSTISSLAGTR